MYTVMEYEYSNEVVYIRHTCTSVHVLMYIVVSIRHYQIRCIMKSFEYIVAQLPLTCTLTKSYKIATIMYTYAIIMYENMVRSDSAGRKEWVDI